MMCQGRRETIPISGGLRMAVKRMDMVAQAPVVQQQEVTPAKQPLPPQEPEDLAVETKAPDNSPGKQYARM